MSMEGMNKKRLQYIIRVQFKETNGTLVWESAEKPNIFLQGHYN